MLHIAAQRSDVCIYVASEMGIFVPCYAAKHLLVLVDLALVWLRPYSLLRRD